MPAQRFSDRVAVRLQLKGHPEFTRVSSASRNDSGRVRFCEVTVK
jgi:hypothetical protein